MSRFMLVFFSVVCLFCFVQERARIDAQQAQIDQLHRIVESDQHVSDDLLKITASLQSQIDSQQSVLSPLVDLVGQQSKVGLRSAKLINRMTDGQLCIYGPCTGGVR